MKLPKIITEVASKIVPWSKGKSLLESAEIDKVPRPGIPKIVSVIIAPPNREENCRIIIVITGSMEDFMACFMTTADFDKPFTLAVSM